MFYLLKANQQNQCETYCKDDENERIHEVTKDEQIHKYV